MERVPEGQVRRRPAALVKESRVGQTEGGEGPREGVRGCWEDTGCPARPRPGRSLCER